MLISAELPDADVLVLSSSKCSFEANQSPLDSVFYRGALFFVPETYYYAYKNCPLGSSKRPEMRVSRRIPCLN